MLWGINVEQPKELRGWRELVARRRHLIRRRTEAKSALRRLLRNAGITPPRRPGVWTKAGRNWLAGLQLPTPDLSLLRDTLLCQVQSFDRQVTQIEQELQHIAKANPDVMRLAQMTGFGFRTAEVVLAAVEEWRRHHNTIDRSESS
jgi:transposase